MKEELLSVKDTYTKVTVVGCVCVCVCVCVLVCRMGNASFVERSEEFGCRCEVKLCF
jgi:hypothetical protein